MENSQTILITNEQVAKLRARQSVGDLIIHYNQLSEGILSSSDPHKTIDTTSHVNQWFINVVLTNLALLKIVVSDGPRVWFDVDYVSSVFKKSVIRGTSPINIFYLQPHWVDIAQHDIYKSTIDSFLKKLEKFALRDVKKFFGDVVLAYRQISLEGETLIKPELAVIAPPPTTVSDQPIPEPEPANIPETIFEPIFDPILPQQQQQQSPLNRRRKKVTWVETVQTFPIPPRKT